MKRIALLLSLTAFLFSAALASNNATEDQDDIYGYWWTPDKDAKIKFYKAKNGKLYGKIVWLKEPYEEDGSPKKDDKNPAEELRDRDILGMVLFMKFEYDDDDEWTNGNVYDAKSGKLYDCNMTLKDKDTLEVRGYVGISLFGRTETFKRAPAP